MLRSELTWEGRAGAATQMASAMRGWRMLRFEVTEDATPGADGLRIACTPSLGVFSASTGANGDILVSENRLREAMRLAAEGKINLDDAVEGLLGKPWDDELEPFRLAGAGAPVRWLNAVG